MQTVTLRRLHGADRRSVVSIRPRESQQHPVATVEASLREDDSNDALTRFAGYDGTQLGPPDPEQGPVGFAVTEVISSVGSSCEL